MDDQAQQNRREYLAKVIAEGPKFCCYPGCGAEIPLATLLESPRTVACYAHGPAWKNLLQREKNAKQRVERAKRRKASA